jgi:hypothetical protein
VFDQAKSFHPDMSHQVFGERYEKKFWTFEDRYLKLVGFIHILWVLFSFLLSEVIFGYKNLEVQVFSSFYLKSKLFRHAFVRRRFI